MTLKSDDVTVNSSVFLPIPRTPTCSSWMVPLSSGSEPAVKVKSTGGSCAWPSGSSLSLPENVPLIGASMSPPSTLLTAVAWKSTTSSGVTSLLSTDVLISMHSPDRQNFSVSLPTSARKSCAIADDRNIDPPALSAPVPLTLIPDPVAVVAPFAGIEMLLCWLAFQLNGAVGPGPPDDPGPNASDSRSSSASMRCKWASGPLMNWNGPLTERPDPDRAAVGEDTSLSSCLVSKVYVPSATPPSSGHALTSKWPVV